MTRLPIRIDPFFDGEGGEVAGPELPRHADAPATQATVAPRGYQDAREVQLESGRPMSAVMRSGPRGMAGTVVPHATLGGIPQGTQPHATRDIEVTVDPHIAGQEVRVRLGDINAESIARAEDMAREVTPDPYNIETQRFRSSAVMRGVAAQAAEVPVPRPEPTTGPQPPGNIEAPHLQRAAGAQPRRQARPLAAFTDPPQNEYEGRPLRPIDLGPPEAPPERLTAPPQVWVTFEIERFGIHRAAYHDVLIDTGFLVLVFDNRYSGAEMYVPPSGEDAPPMALQVDGIAETHLVHTTGFMYSYEGNSFCVLMIERSLPAEPAQ